MKSIADPFKSVMDAVENACQQSPFQQKVSLLAVSKGQSLEAIQRAYDAGLREFGENYVQEAQTKMLALADFPDIVWHYIGPMQSNKTRPVAEHFSWMQTLDRARIADRLNAQRPEHLPPLNVCVQVNISREPQKAGVLPEETLALMGHIQPLPRLRLRGIMAIPAAQASPEAQKQTFVELRQLFEAAQTQFDGLDTLSMGMSGDFQTAIAEGATQVRVGTQLFGARVRPKDA